MLQSSLVGVTLSASPETDSTATWPSPAFPRPHVYPAVLSQTPWHNSSPPSSTPNSWHSFYPSNSSATLIISAHVPGRVRLVSFVIASGGRSSGPVPTTFRIGFGGIFRLVFSWGFGSLGDFLV